MKEEDTEIVQVKRTEVENTPFTIIEINGKCFGALANYRITEEFETVEECKKELEKVTWNRLTQVISIITEILTKN